MLHSIRARLAAWYAGVFALFLAIAALAAYVFLARTTQTWLDDYLTETAEAVGGALDVELLGQADSAAVAEVLREFRLRDMTVAILDTRTGALVTASDLEPDDRDWVPPALRPPPTGLADVLKAAPRGRSARVTLPPRDALSAPVRIVTLHHALRHGDVVIGVAQTMRARAHLLSEAELALALGIPVMLVLATAGGYLLARTSLRPVATMTEQAARIGAGTLDERLPVHNERDELGRLAGVFNDLLGRLGAAFQQQRRFMADASHELRTPVAIVRGEAELALSRDDRAPEELRGSLAVIGEAAEHLGHTVDDLFLLARADGGEQPLRPVDLDLAELTDDCVRAVRSLASHRGVALTFDGVEELPYRGDERLLHRLFTNLLDNAIKYTPAGGAVVVTTARDGDEYRITVADTGPGIPAAAQQRIFDRFYRVRRDAGAPGADVAGAGLGLAIARWIAEAHGAQLVLEHSSESGSVFSVRFSTP
jgi:two-component system, OmpR family, sensor kinase